MEKVESNLALYARSVGWLIDRSVGKEDIIGSVFLVDGRLAATAAHTCISYTEMLDALLVRFPAAHAAYGVADITFHPGFDHWMAKRLVDHADFFPPPAMASLEQNVALLDLVEPVKPISWSTSTRIEKSMDTPAEVTSLSGRVTNIELAGIIQSLVSARKKGTIVVSDSHRRTFARLYCENGQITYGRYLNSFNELAIYRLVSTPFKGLFSFKEEDKPSWCTFAPMTKSTTSVIIEAYMRLEGKDPLLENIGGSATRICRANVALRLDQIDDWQRSDVQNVWDNIHPGTTIGRLMSACSLDGYTVLSAVNMLIMNGQVRLLAPDQHEFETKEICRLQISSRVTLGPEEEVVCLSIDANSGKPVMEKGKIIGPRNIGDPYHQLHSIEAPAETVGAPIFKNNVVVGINCGQLIVAENGNSPSVKNNYMLWAESIENMISEMKGVTVPEYEEVTLTASFAENDILPGTAQEIRSNKTTAHTKNFAASTQTRLVALMDTVSNVFQANGKARIHANDWFEVAATRAQFATTAWEPANASTIFRPGDLLRLHISLLRDIHLYIFYERNSGRNVHLLFPEPGAVDTLKRKGTIIELPRRSDCDPRARSSSGKFGMLGFSISDNDEGTDSLLFVASSKRFFAIDDHDSFESIFRSGLTLLNGKKNLVMSSSTVGELVTELEGDSDPIVLGKMRISYRH